MADKSCIKELRKRAHTHTHTATCYHDNQFYFLSAELFRLGNPSAKCVYERVCVCVVVAGMCSGVRHVGTERLISGTQIT